jgi:hypothetical protein
MTDAKWYFSEEQLANSPSRKCGINGELELSYRQRAANLIQEMGQRLQVYVVAFNIFMIFGVLKSKKCEKYLGKIMPPKKSPIGLIFHELTRYFGLKISKQQFLHSGTSLYNILLSSMALNMSFNAKVFSMMKSPY